ncbi:IS66 family insertion sequence element accessory protein TnpB (plasmid) [Escherichia coli]|nr:IS66 family insertion sequence element accessory protein TnpB [Escherichia coli]
MLDGYSESSYSATPRFAAARLPWFSGHLFIFRGRRGDQIKVLWADSDGLCLFTKRLERGRFVWPVTRDGKVHLTPAQLSMLLEGIDWKHPKRTERAGIRI